MPISFHKRDHYLRESLRLHNQSEAYRHQAVLARQRGAQATNHSTKVKQGKKAAQLQTRSDELAKQSKAVETKYFKADRTVRRQIRQEPDGKIRENLKQRDISRKADIHLEAAGKTKAPTTREGTQTSLIYMGPREKPSKINNYAHGTDLSQKVTVTESRKGETVAQYPHRKYGAGGYYSRPNSTPDRVGIDASKRKAKQVQPVKRKTSSLESKAAPARDNFSDPQRRTVTHTRGGDKQMVIKESQQNNLGKPEYASSRSARKRAAFGSSKQTKAPSYGKSVSTAQMSAPRNVATKK